MPNTKKVERPADSSSSGGSNEWGDNQKKEEGKKVERPPDSSSSGGSDEWGDKGKEEMKKVERPKDSSSSAGSNEWGDHDTIKAPDSFKLPELKK